MSSQKSTMLNAGLILDLLKNKNDLASQNIHSKHFLAVKYNLGLGSIPIPCIKPYNLTRGVLGILPKATGAIEDKAHVQKSNLLIWFAAYICKNVMTAAFMCLTLQLVKFSFIRDLHES